MVLRVSLLIATLALVSTPFVRAEDCDETNEEWISDNIMSYETLLDNDCYADKCSSACVEDFESMQSEVPDCTASDGNNWYEKLTEMYTCSSGSSSASTAASTSSSSTTECTEDEESTISDLVSEYSPGSCVSTPCESDCSSRLYDFVMAVPVCISSQGIDYYETYVSYLNVDCSSASASTSSASASASTSTESSAASAASTSGGSSAASEATSSSASAAASASTAGSASATASASASKDSGAAAITGSSLVVAGALALLAAQA